MHRRELVPAALLSGALLAPLAARAAAQTVPLETTLQPYLGRYGLPALAAAVQTGGTLAAAGAVGTRRAGFDIPVTRRDPFSIGSDTKAMTSLIAAIFVEQGKLGWQTTVAEVFPELAGTMNAGLKGVTLVQLLSHTSGIPSDNDAFFALMIESFAQDGLNLDELRYWLVKKWSPLPLESPPGTRFAYSNMGYTLVGAILERTAKSTWEELIVEHVFTPFGFATAGLGPAASLGRVDAPLGHLPRENAPPKPMLAGPNGDVPEIIGPAGSAHLSIVEFASWAGWNAGEGRRPPSLVRPETLRKLHTPVIKIPMPGAAPGTPAAGGYGLGWGTITADYSSEPLIQHSGSNGMNLAMVMLQPKHDFAMVMATNVGGTKADDALRALAAALYGRFGPAPKGATP
ncbi:MAG TPA: serine hydrolase domain-containing protein [Acetobacteraceae bacterium]|nr:serine hydrolase domain-containing protein [Acetobacteraceae bacterium]